MNRASRINEWHMFLGTRDDDALAAELTRLVHRLDDAYDAINYVMRQVVGSPECEAEGCIHVARTSLTEGIEYLQDVLKDVRRHDPDAA